MQSLQWNKPKYGMKEEWKVLTLSKNVEGLIIILFQSHILEVVAELSILSLRVCLLEEQIVTPVCKDKEWMEVSFHLTASMK